MSISNGAEHYFLPLPDQLQIDEGVIRSVLYDHTGGNMNQARLKSLLARSIDPSSVESHGRYTNPRTWGVYHVKCLPEGKRFHFGNHPIRQKELIRQYGEAPLVGLYKARIDAKEAAYILNGRDTH